MPASDVEAICRGIYRGTGGQFMNILKERVYCQRNRRAVEKNSRGTKDQLLIDKMILKNCRRRKTGLVMVWVDYKNTYDMIPHLFIECMIIDCMNMFGIAENLTGVTG